MAKLLCIKTLSTKHITFREGEIYKGNKVNDNWWCVDAVGVDANIFDRHFVNKDYISGFKANRNNVDDEEELMVVTQ